MTDQVNEAVADRLCAIANEIYSAWEHDNDSRVGKMLRALADPAFASQYRADIADLHASLNAPHPSRGVVDDSAIHRALEAYTAINGLSPIEKMRAALQAAALPAVPEVDLEQFRRPVTAWRALAEIGVFADYMPHHFRKPADEYSARVKEADRLLAIINAATPAHDQPEGEGP